MKRKKAIILPLQYPQFYIGKSSIKLVVEASSKSLSKISFIHQYIFLVTYLLTDVIPEDELLCLPCYYDCIKNVPFCYVYWVV